MVLVSRMSFDKNQGKITPFWPTSVSDPVLPPLDDIKKTTFEDLMKTEQRRL